MTRKPRSEIKPEANEGIIEAIWKAGGSQASLAKIMLVSQPAVSHWLYKRCPPKQAVKIEKMLGVRRELICPEIYG